MTHGYTMLKSEWHSTCPCPRALPFVPMTSQMHSFNTGMQVMLRLQYYHTAALYVFIAEKSHVARQSPRRSCWYRWADFKSFADDKCRNTWTELKPEGVRPKARYAHSLTSCNGRVYLFGGESNTCEYSLPLYACQFMHASPLVWFLPGVASGLEH